MLTWCILNARRYSISLLLSAFDQSLCKFFQNVFQLADREFVNDLRKALIRSRLIDEAEELFGDCRLIVGQKLMNRTREFSMRHRGLAGQDVRQANQKIEILEARSRPRY